MEYTILIHQAEEGGFWAEVPALSGCFSQGETIEETMKNTSEAIEAYIQCLQDDHEPVPHEDNLIISRVRVDSGSIPA
ncbi:MAG: type II toxin-antitoxin system HicB family antitoxin [Methanoregulaceae archaeon]